MFDLPNASALVTIMATIIGAVWTVSFMFLRKFQGVTNLIYSKTDEIKDLFLVKLDNHEKKDEERFTSLSNDIWIMRVRNAAKDGLIEVHNTKENH